MANMSANITRPFKGEVYHQRYGLVGYTNYQSGSTAYTAYKGAIMMLDVSDVDGYAQPMVSTITAASGDVFLGIAEEKVSVTASDTADGTKNILIATAGIWGFPKGALAVTDIGAPIYATDDQTITTTSSNALCIGTLVNVDDTYAWVKICVQAGHANTAV